MTRAFIFPGQGSQAIGMGKTLAENFVVAKKVYEEVDDALNEKLSEIIWHGTIEDLTLTENTQPALMATSIALLNVLESEGLPSNFISYVAGHSLGEYTALCASKAISLSDTTKLLRLRGKAMQASVPTGEGSMAAILGLSITEVKKLILKVPNIGICDVANDNDPKQVVISGNTDMIEKVTELSKECGAKRAVVLSVSAPFHCKLMQPAAEIMKEALENVNIVSPKVPIIMNVNAKTISDVNIIRKNLYKQMTGLVRWRETIMCLSKLGTTKVYELGPGRILTGMVRRTSPKILTTSINQYIDIKKFLEENINV